MIARAAASVIIAGALLLGTSACSFFAPQATLIHYEPSDGTAATVGDIKARNVIALSDDGVTANLIMTVINEGDTRQLVTFQYTDATETAQTASVYVGPGRTNIVYADSEESITLAGLDIVVGSLFPVYVQYGDEEGKSMLVPVLDGTQEQFSTLLPTPAVTSTAIPE